MNASTHTGTLARAAAELAARHAREIAKLETAARIVAELPPGLPLPLIANERDDANPIEPAADAHGYRAPRNANGSRARSFYAALNRASRAA